MELLSEMPRIFWAGDSTVKQNDFTSYPQCGIGQGFSLFVKKEIIIVNRAENGRSTKSFIDWNLLRRISAKAISFLSSLDIMMRRMTR